MTTKFDAILIRVEKRITTVVVGVVVGLILLGLAHIYVDPAPGPVNHGGEYNIMSHAPFNLEEGRAMQNRILTPLLAHYAYYLPFFHDQDFILFIDFIGLIFLASIYLGARRDGLSPSLSAVAAAVMAFSAPILFFIHFAGYTDITSYTLIFLAMMSVRNNLVWPWILALALLNHENNFFAFPWFMLFYYLRNDRKISRTLVAILLMAASALPWYWWVGFVASHKPPTYTLAYYLSLSVHKTLLLTAANLYTGFFQAFKLFWALPVYAAWVHVRDRNLAEIGLYLLIVACAAAQLCFAFDTSRLFTAAFPVIWLGFITLAKRVDSGVFNKCIVHLIVLNLFVPQYYVGADKLVRFHSVPASWLLRKVFNMNVFTN